MTALEDAAIKANRSGLKMALLFIDLTSLRKLTTLTDMMLAMKYCVA